MHLTPLSRDLDFPFSNLEVQDTNIDDVELWCPILRWVLSIVVVLTREGDLLWTPHEQDDPDKYPDLQYSTHQLYSSCPLDNLILVRKRWRSRQRVNKHTSNSNTKIISNPLVIPSGLFCFPHLKLVMSGWPVFSLTHFSARASNADIKVDWAEASADDLIPTLYISAGHMTVRSTHQCGRLSFFLRVWR